MKHSTATMERSNGFWQKAGMALCLFLSFVWINIAQATSIEKQEANPGGPGVYLLRSDELVDLVGPIALFRMIF